MKNKAQLQMDLIRADKAIKTLRKLLKEIRSHAHEQVKKGTSFNPGWLIEHITGELTRADIERNDTNEPN